MKIKVESEVICGMAGPVTYFTKQCPYGEKSLFGGVSAVGSTACKMCRHYAGQVDDGNILCNHE